MTGMLGDSPHRNWQRGCGNGCCSPKADDRHTKRGVKIIEKREVEKLVVEELAPEISDEAYNDDDFHGEIYEEDRRLQWRTETPSRHSPEYYAPPAPYTTETPK